MDKLVILARELRKNATPQEHKVWTILRNHQFHGLEFKRQYPIGNYIVDFICRPKKLIIEIDGSQHNTPEGIKYDEQRTKYLEEHGYTILRFWNSDVDNNIEGIYTAIENFLTMVKD